jgi:malate synthase
MGVNLDSNREARQVRVFISSTFRDMHAERDHLVTVVFPELRERVEQLGLEFFDVDLRWGVPAKDLNGETANSWEYCRQWIDRVEPFFVCLLGQRYGWVPEPRHFRNDADRQRQQREPRSITDLEVRHAVLDTRRKRRSYFYLRATPVPEPNAEYVDPPEY